MMVLRLVLVIAAAAAMVVSPLGALASSPHVISFVNGATFFSQVMQSARVIDPQVFVYDGLVAVGTGPQGIEHTAGLRNARLDDPRFAPIYNAEGRSLGLTLRKWQAARGTLEVQTLANGDDRVIANFKHLVPFGVYSLFTEELGRNGAVIASRPLDSDGSGSSFRARADGAAMMVWEGPHIAHDNVMVLVYHSDGKEHGASRGRPGVTMHEQLAARLPAAGEGDI